MPSPPSRNMRVYIGIDPGQSGGLVAITAEEVMATPMPSTERDVWDWISQYEEDWAAARITPAVAVIEKVHSFPGQGVVSTFKFGMGYGGLRMALIASSIPFEEVTPRTWQKALSIPPKKKTESNSQWKNRLKQKAQQLFPEVKVTLKTADALLIAEFCRRSKR